MAGGAPLNTTGGVSFDIPTLVALAGTGAIRIPTFQRSFVWGSKDVLDLFDSLYRGFPVGTLLLWRRWTPAGKAVLGPVRLEVGADQEALWVVDGQQRITSLFVALSPEHKGVDEKFEVYFDLSSERFVNARRGVVPARSIPVRVALESRSLLNWLRLHEDDLEPEDYDLADRLGGALRDYKLPAYIVSGNNQELLREVFDRVNSAGKPMSRAQVFHALFASDQEPGSPASVVAELSSAGFGGLHENRVVQSLLAIRGGNVQRDMHDEFGAGEDPADWYDRTERALAKAINFLKSEGAQHVLLLPSTLPLPVLAAFFHLHPDPEPWIRRLLARWLWRGWVHGFGSESGQTPTLRRAIRAVNPEHRRPENAPSSFEAVSALLGHAPDRQVPELVGKSFTTNSATSKLILLALASIKPRDEHADVLDIPGELSRHGMEAVAELVPGHRTTAAARGFWRPGSARLIDVVDPVVLVSHAIEREAAAALAERNWSDFLTIRKDRMGRLTTAYLASRTEPGALLRPPLRDLAVAGMMRDE